MMFGCVFINLDKQIQIILHSATAMKAHPIMDFVETWTCLAAFSASKWMCMKFRRHV